MRFAKKSLGQNFLVDPNYQRKIIAATEDQYNGETIIEIGPGQGALTQHLQRFSKNLILVEKDHVLAEKLASSFSEQKSVHVVRADFLDWDLSSLPRSHNLVIANLPYNVSTQILIRLLQNMHKFSRLILMFQKEVAERCVASPGSKTFGILSVWVQLFAKARKICDVPPNAFRPRPKITSTVLEFLPTGLCYDENQEKFIQFVKLIFSQRRKKIGSILKRSPQSPFGRAAPDMPCGMSNRNARGEPQAGGSGRETLPLLGLRAEALSIAQMQELYTFVGARRAVPLPDS